jgi:hypothetical protein
MHQQLVRLRHSIGSFWRWLQGPPDYRRARDLRELARMQPRVRFDPGRVAAAGWLTSSEQRALYSLARWAQGPFLEIGPWLGLSTTIIALGIADSGEAKEFVTREYNPTLANFRPLPDGTIGLFIPADSTESMGACSHESFENDIRPIVAGVHGVIGQLTDNLRRARIDHLVRVSVGDFRELETRTYHFVFADTMHNALEIQRNAPQLRRFLTVGSILACHDTTAENERLLRELFSFAADFRADSLFVGKIA